MPTLRGLRRAASATQDRDAQPLHSSGTSISFPAIGRRSYFGDSRRYASWVCSGRLPLFLLLQTGGVPPAGPEAPTARIPSRPRCGTRRGESALRAFPEPVAARVAPPAALGEHRSF